MLSKSNIIHLREYSSLLRICTTYLYTVNMQLGWRSFFELRTLEVACTGRRGPMFPKSVYYQHAPHLKRPLFESEADLHEDCAKCLHNVGWKVVAHEWPALARTGKRGVGDLVFERSGMYLVIECKRKSKPKVYEQAAFYSQVWAEQHTRALTMYGIWTCYHQELLGRRN